MKREFVSSVLGVVSVVAVPLAMLAVAAPASAQGPGQRELFEWRGNVDQEVRVQMQGGRAMTMDMGPREMTGYNNVRAFNSVPSVNGYVSVRMAQGRGRADVVQQPTAQNGYTTVIRIRDTESGAGSYDVAAFWQPDGNYGYGNSGYGNSGYGNYGTYNQNGQYGSYGQYGQYGQYPAPVVRRRVIVEQPVYGDRGEARAPGKTLPVPPRGSVNSSRGRYPVTAPYGGQYEPNNAQRGKTLPAANQPSQSGEQGKTLPGTSGTNQRGNPWPRG